MNADSFKISVYYIGKIRWTSKVSRADNVLYQSYFFFDEISLIDLTRLSGKGRIIIPKTIRRTHRWAIGQEFTVEEARDGTLPRPKSLFPRTHIEEVAGCLKYAGAPKTLENI